ncbi:MAG TPA: urease accessory protein UreE [Puia sp.]|nr:urease accessory protein UreE [Puia sp.]
MLIQEKIGNLHDPGADPGAVPHVGANSDPRGREIDWVELEWYEADKRVLRKRTRSGRDLALKFLGASPAFMQGDILYASETHLIAVEILPCEAIVVMPASALELASLCYEIGNKHLPLFWENGELLAPFEAPLFRWMTAAGYAARKEKRRLLQPLRTSVAAHAHTGGAGSLFSRIMQLADPKE